MIKPLGSGSSSADTISFFSKSTHLSEGNTISLDGSERNSPPGSLPSNKSSPSNKKHSSIEQMTNNLKVVVENAKEESQ